MSTKFNSCIQVQSYVCNVQINFKVQSQSMQVWKNSKKFQSPTSIKQGWKNFKKFSKSSSSQLGLKNFQKFSKFNSSNTWVKKIQKFQSTNAWLWNARKFWKYPKSKPKMAEPGKDFKVSNSENTEWKNKKINSKFRLAEIFSNFSWIFTIQH